MHSYDLEVWASLPLIRVEISLHEMSTFFVYVDHARPPYNSVYSKKSYFSTKRSNDVGAQKNRLNGTVLLSTQNKC